MNKEDASRWVGRQQRALDTIDCNRALAMAAMLDGSGINLVSGSALPPLWHWLYFWEMTENQGLAADGHSKRGSFLPPIELPRRMWAGGELEFLQPLKLGAMAERSSRIENIENKEGRSGSLSFVTVSHEISSEGACCIREKQSIVYRDAARPAPAIPAPIPAATSNIEPAAIADFSREIHPDPLLLFRYSALTFNAHRIHYDRGYVTDDEGYPGLLVHGPLLATLLADLLMSQNPDCILRSFNFRAVAPVFDLEPFKVCGTTPDESGEAKLWVTDQTGQICMKATTSVEF